MVERQFPGPPATGDATAAGNTGEREPARPHLAVAEAREAPAEPDPDRHARSRVTLERLLANFDTVVRGKRDEIRLVLCALACQGHVLFEDVPGTAKTVLARAIAQSIAGAVPSRIQCTPDLQPADVTGSSIFNQKTREFEFRAGPIFANVVLVAEINRATPKTQASLLEAMAEHQVTVDGVTRPLPQPFLVLATENPIEHEGTFMLPEAQLDRFFLRTTLGYPDAGDEHRILLDQRHGHPLESLRPVVRLEDVTDLQRAVEDVYSDRLIQRWVVELVRGTRELEVVELGASVRGSISLERAARAWALLEGRDYVVPGDVEALLIPVIGHRVLFTPSFLASARTKGLAAALEEFKRNCLERRPRPLPAYD
jgi:MoxR-like ATPase